MTEDPASPTPARAVGEPLSPRRHTRRRLVLVILGCAGLLVVAGVVLALVRYLPAYEDAKALQADVRAIVDRVKAAGVDLDGPALTEIRADLDRAAARLAGLDSLLRDDPLVALARSFPPTRDAVVGADGVAAAGDALLDGVRVGLGLGDRFVAIREQHAAGAVGDTTLASMVALMATSTGEADTILADLQKARAALGTVPADVPSVLAGARDEILARLDTYEPLLLTYTQIDGTLPAILGWDHPVRYLVLTQDPAELRPSGGFIGSAGIIGFDKGRITELKFMGTDGIDLPDPERPFNYPWIAAPNELVGYLLGPRQPWQFADANWAPDFPAAARDSLRLYSNETGDVRFDGVLAMTTQSVDELLVLTGPISVPGFDVTIASGEATRKILENTRRAAPGQERKAILGALASELVSRLLALPPGKWVTLADEAETIRAERLLQAWFTDTAAQAFVASHGWDGAVRIDAGDYVYAVDANVAPVSKLNAVTIRSTALDVTLDEVGNARSTMTLSWDNGIDTPDGAFLRALTGVGSLHDLGLFERVLVPSRSRLESVAGGSYQQLTGPAMDAETGGRHVFGNYLRVPPGTTSLTYTWTAPYVAELTADASGNPKGGTYHLVVQKQPGLRAGALTLHITAPPGMTITSASEGCEVSGAMATLTVPVMDRDVEVAVGFGGAAP